MIRLHFLLPIAPLVLGLCFASCGDSPAKSKPYKPSAPPVPPGTPISIGHPTAKVGDGGPIDFIAANCAKCHGAEASLHKPEAISKYLDDDKLHTIIHTMVKNQVPKDPPDGDEFETLVSYHRSVIKHEPFITVTDAKLPTGTGDGTITLEGEVSSKSEMTYTVKGETSKLVLDGPYWTAIVPSDATEVIFTAVKDGAKTVVVYPQHTHSHDAPLTP